MRLGHLDLVAHAIRLYDTKKTPEITRHGRASIFRRYHIVAESDVRDAARLLDQRQENQFGHSSGIGKPQSQAKEEDLKVEVLTTQ